VSSKNLSESNFDSLKGRLIMAAPDYQVKKNESQNPTRLFNQLHNRLFVFLLYAVMAVLLFTATGCSRSGKESLSRAAEAWDSEDYESAAEEYERYLQLESTGEESIGARFRLANIYYLNLRRYDQARAHYQEMLTQDASHPDAPLARERLAESLAELGRSYEAIAEYENINPADDNERRRLRLRIADLYSEQRNYNQALTEYERVIEGAGYDELTEQSYSRQATIYHIARSQFQEALPIYQLLATQSSDSKTVRRAIYGIADCYAGMFQFDEAVKTLKQITDQDEQDYIARRIEELEQQKREAAQARGRVEQLQ
jgi:tetratricopeptide (TPR) repeat protein